MFAVLKHHWEKSRQYQLNHLRAELEHTTLQIDKFTARRDAILHHIEILSSGVTIKTDEVSIS